MELGLRTNEEIGLHQLLGPWPTYEDEYNAAEALINDLADTGFFNAL